MTPVDPRPEQPVLPHNPYRALVHGAAFCRFSGCYEFAFAESRWGPLCEEHYLKLEKEKLT